MGMSDVDDVMRHAMRDEEASMMFGQLLRGVGVHEDPPHKFQVRLFKKWKDGKGFIDVHIFRDDVHQGHGEFCVEMTGWGRAVCDGEEVEGSDNG